MAVVPDTRAEGRYEAKYLLPPDIRTALRCDLDLLMQRDTFSSDGAYTVSTLYFDTQALSAFYEKLDGDPDRVKFRIRQYGNDSDVRRLELKQRTYNRSRKRRCTLDNASYRAIVAGHFPLRLSADPIVRAYACERARRGISPRAVVTYRRDAYHWPADTDVRVTIDSDLRVHRAASFERRMLLELNALPRGASILELKWDRAFPDWLQRLVRKYGLRHAALSKYCLGIEALIRHGFIPRT